MRGSYKLWLLYYPNVIPEENRLLHKGCWVNFIALHKFKVMNHNFWTIWVTMFKVFEQSVSLSHSITHDWSHITFSRQFAKDTMHQCSHHTLKSLLKPLLSEIVAQTLAQKQLVERASETPWNVGGIWLCLRGAASTHLFSTLIRDRNHVGLVGNPF